MHGHGGQSELISELISEFSRHREVVLSRHPWIAYPRVRKQEGAHAADGVGARQGKGLLLWCARRERRGGAGHVEPPSAVLPSGGHAGCKGILGSRDGGG